MMWCCIKNATATIKATACLTTYLLAYQLLVRLHM